MIIRTCSSILMYSIQNTSDERLGSRVRMSAHRTRHSLKRSRSTLSPRLETVDVKMMSTSCFCGCFPRKVTVAHSTFSRYIGRWRKKVRPFRVSPTHWIILVLCAFALRSTLDHLRTPFVYRRYSTWGPWSRIRCMNTTRCTPICTLVSTWCTGMCQCRAWQPYGNGQTRWARWTRV
jgi:hypothetical protein